MNELPSRIANRSTIDFIGRIDNKAELTIILGSGISGEAGSLDTLLLAGWQRWWTVLPSNLLGDFAFAIRDEAQKTTL